MTEEVTLRQIYDEAIAANSVRGRLDHYAAARQVRAEVEALEGGGISWAFAAREAAELDGWVKKVKARAKQAVVHLPTRLGDRTVPAAYSRKRDDGGRQLCLWVDLPVVELVELIQELDDQSAVLAGRVETMQLGVLLAEKHGVTTAREAFAAEGFAVEGVA